MILGNRGQFIESRFIFISQGEIYDPTIRATPVDIYFSIVRGSVSSGAVVDGPYSYLRGNSEIADKVQVIRTGNGQFTFRYKIPIEIREGTYSILAKTTSDFGEISLSSPFQVKGSPVTLSPVVISNNSSTIVNYKPSYDDLNRANTRTVLLIGHADNLELNVPVKIRSMQSAIDLLGGDIRSPLLRGVFDAYAAGARDIFIMAAAPLAEYTENYEDRLIPSIVYNISAATPSSQTFYQKYYQRLIVTYSILKELDYIDYIVPLETSIIKTGGVNFITQLAAYLADFHNETGFVQIGVIGSRSGGISNSDIQDLKSSATIVNKLTQYNSDGTISSDIGRFVIPVYGEGVFQHSQLKTSYASSMSASFAGMFASMPLNMALIRTRLPGVMSLYGNDLSQQEMLDLEGLGINTIYRGRKTRRSTPFEVYATNEYTMANPSSTLQKASQMRIIATVISEVKNLAYDAIGRFGYDRAVDNVRNLLQQMKSVNILVDFTFNIEVDPRERGKIIFHIQLLSALGLRKIDFAIAAGPEA